MMLQGLLVSKVLDAAHRQIILIVVSQINLLLCLINDLLDSKMIQQGLYRHQAMKFSPVETFKFIIDVFQQ